MCSQLAQSEANTRLTLRCVSVIYMVLQAVRRSKAGKPFAEPVVLDDVPGYLAVVSQPMDLGTVIEGLFAGRYQTPGVPGCGISGIE